MLSIDVNQLRETWIWNFKFIKMQKEEIDFKPDK